MVIPGVGGGWTGGGLSLRRLLIPEDEIVTREGFRTTSALRTLADLSGRLDVTESVVLADTALSNQLVLPDDLGAWAARHAGRKGVRRFRVVAELARPGVESPMETRLRMAIVLGGLPEPEVQANIFDADGYLIGRADLLYRDERIVIEYDGESHRTSLVYDSRRQNRLVAADYTVLRFTAPDLRAPNFVADRVRGALRRAA